MSSDLKPCPFCGHNARAVSECIVADRVHAVRCDRCEGEWGIYDTPNEAAAAWNTRAPCPECDRLRARVAALEAVAVAARALSDTVHDMDHGPLAGRHLRVLDAALAALDKPHQGQPEGGKEE